MTATQPNERRTRLSMWIGGAVALGIAAVTLFLIWGIALPVTPPDTICPAIYPPFAGCAGDARLLPAFVWSALVAVAVAAAFLLSRRSWLGVVAGAAITGVVGAAGYTATLYMNVFLFG